MIYTYDDFNTFAYETTEERLKKLKFKFQENDEFIIIPNFLSEDIVAKMQLELEKIKEDVHRSYIPNHKKGGSIPRTTLKKKSPLFTSIYESEKIQEFFKQITDRDLFPCPGRDLHACALYLYTEEGDHIDYHFDTSYYNGDRYTALLGIINRSRSLLEYELFHRRKGQQIIKDATLIEPGTLVFFNGDKLRHRVTPAAAGDKRIVLTLEFVTDPEMALTKRFISNMKDAIAYFGFKKVFGRTGS